MRWVRKGPIEQLVYRGHVVGGIERLRSIHDHKGTLTVAWHNAAFAEKLKIYVDQSWADERELCAHHLVDARPVPNHVSRRSTYQL